MIASIIRVRCVEAGQSPGVDVAGLLETDHPRGLDVVFQNQSSIDALNMDTVCRLYEVGRQRLAEDEDEEEDQVSGLRGFFLSHSLQGPHSPCRRGHSRAAPAACRPVSPPGLARALGHRDSGENRFRYYKTCPVPSGPVSPTVNWFVG